VSIKVTEHIIKVPAPRGHYGILAHLADLERKFSHGGRAIRFVISAVVGSDYQCELGVLHGSTPQADESPHGLFELRPRRVVNRERFTTVFVVPTGIGAEIGGHAGDAAPAARLLAQASDTLVTHPNVVNASDLNEIPDNALYVEGSVISRLMMGTIGLERRTSNRVLVVMEEHREQAVTDWSINAVNAARASCGYDCSELVRLKPSFDMSAHFSDAGRAIGAVDHLERLFAVLDAKRGSYDAVALTSTIKFPYDATLEYWQGDGGVNPWGGVEAMLTHAVSACYQIPSAHSPQLIATDWLSQAGEEVGDPSRVQNGLGVVEPTMAAECVSLAFLHCVLKGLHRSPGIVVDRDAMRHHSVLTSSDVSCLVQPDRCIGLPTLAALEQRMPVIAVADKRNNMRNDLANLPWAPGQLMLAQNYVEAAGMLCALRGGVQIGSLRRPLHKAKSEVVSPTKEG